MTIYVDDPDFTLHVGDVRDVLAGLPDGSVNCVVTSPPYWGLRDYGTGLWEGGDPNCDHRAPIQPQRDSSGGVGGGRIYGTRGEQPSSNNVVQQFRDVCGKCGASRVDQQLGLEATPDLYVASMVAVFREVRRVLRVDGTCWLNLGDSYMARQFGWGTSDDRSWAAYHRETGDERKKAQRTGHSMEGSNAMSRATGLKPKDLVGIPWRVAFALQADGWYLRSDIVWSKPNPMPESVTDRPTKSHEYVFLLTRSPRYWFDQEAVREPAEWNRWGDQTVGKGSNPNGWIQPKTREELNANRSSYHGGTTGNTLAGHEKKSDAGLPVNPAGRNVRSVWEIATQPYSEAHFATFPEELVRRCLLAGCPEVVCGTCGKPRERIVERGRAVTPVSPVTEKALARANGEGIYPPNSRETGGVGGLTSTETVGWSDCGHSNWTAGTVLDPFMGSGTTALVARRHGRRAIGIELNQDYAALAARRLQQLSLLA